MTRTDKGDKSNKSPIPSVVTSVLGAIDYGDTYTSIMLRHGGHKISRTGYYGKTAGIPLGFPRATLLVLLETVMVSGRQIVG